VRRDQSRPLLGLSEPLPLLFLPSLLQRLPPPDPENWGCWRAPTSLMYGSCWWNPGRPAGTACRPRPCPPRSWARCSPATHPDRRSAGPATASPPIGVARLAAAIGRVCLYALSCLRVESGHQPLPPSS